MQNNSQNFSMQDMMRIAQSPTGQQLISLLKQSDPSQLKKLSAMASSGNMDQAKDVLQQMLRSNEAQTLMQKLEEENG